MTNEQAKKMLKAKLECLKRETSGTDFDCNNSNCDECSLCYEQGNMGEQKEALDMAIKALEQQYLNPEADREESKAYCAECDHIEMCSWYPHDGCEWLKTDRYNAGYNAAKREIALSGEYERAYERGKADAHPDINDGKLSEIPTGSESEKSNDIRMSETILYRLVPHEEGTVLPPEHIAIGDWIDLRCAKSIVLAKGQFMIIPLGIAMKVPDGYESILAPRSSTCKKFGIIQANSIGVLDNSFAGDNDEWGMPVIAVRDTEIQFNDRICQFRIQKNQPEIVFKQVQHLPDKDRGGWGSTGVH